MAGVFAFPPRGIILHGSRSGQSWSIGREFVSTRNYAASGADGLGWNATIGPDAYSMHMTAREWGWNAREASRTYLAVEFAQSTVDEPITVGQVRAFVHWYAHEVVPVWGALDLSRDDALPMHSELAAGRRDGKSDVFPLSDRRGDDLRARIRGAL